MLTKPNGDGYVRKNFKVEGGYTKEGRQVVVAEWPEEEDGRVFDRDEAVIFGLYLVQVASRLYSSAQEFQEVMNYARTKVMGLEAIIFPPPEATDGAENRPGA